MTPEERAEEAAQHAGGDGSELIASIARAIREAVEEEREACAKLADERAAICKEAQSLPKET
jgi:hypothetical protein